MSECWPLDVKRSLDEGVIEGLRPFKCLLLMPFEGRFNAVAEVIRSVLCQRFWEQD